MPDAVGVTHHVKIGSYHYTLRPGSWRRRGAPQFGSRFTTGDPDYNNMSAWQHWVQTCWIGGPGAWEWKDDGMYDEGIGVDTRNHEIMVLSRDVGPHGTPRATVGGGGENWGLNASTYPKIFFKHQYALYCLDMGQIGVQAGRVYRWSPDAPTVEWLLIYTFPSEVRSATQWGNNVVFGVGIVNLYRMSGAPGVEAFATITKPANKQGVNDKPSSMGVYKNKLYVDFGTQIWRLKPDFTWDGSTPFYEDNSIDYSTQMEVHQGFLYIGTNNGHILRTDGNNTFDMWQFEPGIHIWGMRSFDGKLFLYCGDQVDAVNNDPFDGGKTRHAILYQFSGAAITEIKRFGRVGRYIAPSRLYIHDGKLYFGAADLLGMGTGTGGFGIAMYDPVEDAVHLVAANRNTTTYVGGTDNVKYLCDDVTYHDGYLWVSVRGHGIFRSAHTYRDMERLLATYDNSAAGGSVGSLNGGWYEASEFDAGTPGVQKLWNAIILDLELPHTSTAAFVEYSLDGGLTWVNAASITTGTTFRGQYEIVLGNSVNEVRGNRFKYRITLRTTNTSYSPYLRGVVVRYLPIPEPNWAFDMTLVLSEKQVLLDGTIQVAGSGGAATIATKIAALRSAFRTQALIPFTDPEGTQYAAAGKPGVVIHAFDEMAPHLGPTANGEREYEIRLTLLEMVEQYEAYQGV